MGPAVASDLLEGEWLSGALTGHDILDEAGYDHAGGGATFAHLKKMSVQKALIKSQSLSK